jgi:hypothetical protein
MPNSEGSTDEAIGRPGPWKEAGTSPDPDQPA